MNGDWCAGELELDGQPLRFGPDESDVGDVPSSIEWKSSAPGGWTSGSCIVHRPEWATREKLLLKPWRFYGRGGKTRFDGRIRDVVQVSPDEIRLDLEGWIAHLDDNEFWRFLGVHNDVSEWAPPSLGRQAALVAFGVHPVSDGGAEYDETGLSSLVTRLVGAWSQTVISELQLSVENLPLGQILASWRRNANLDYTNPNYSWSAGLGADDKLTSIDQTANLRAAGPGTATVTATAVRRVAFVQLLHGVAGGPESMAHDIIWNPSVFGAHGLTPRQLSDGRWGLRGSDAIRYAIADGAPLLTYSDDSIEESTFDFPHLVHLSGGVKGLIENVTALGGSTREQNDWGVYEDREFFWLPPGARGRTWRLRRDEVVIPNEDGATSENRCAGVVVVYRDSAGRSKSVGPTGSGADVELAELLDTSENNPAAEVPNRFKVEDAGVTSLEGATLISAAKLAELNTKTRRGTATIVGTARDEAGNEAPADEVRAFDRVLIEDEDEGGLTVEEMPVNSTSYSHDNLTTDANLGAEPFRIGRAIAELAARTPA